MKRRVVTALILMAVVVEFVGSFPGRAQDKGSEHIQKKADDDKSHTKPLPSPIIQPNAAQDQEKPGASVATGNIEQPVRFRTPIAVNTVKDRWDKALVFFTGLIVGVGFFQIIFLWRTVAATKDNAKAARDGAEAAKASAEAAKASVDAIVSSERSWVLGQVEDLSVTDMLWKAQGHEVVPVICTFRNYGIKPVWIVACAFNLSVVDSATELPENPDYGTWQPFEAESPLLPESSGLYFRRPVALPVAELGPIMARKRQLYVYGFVAYRDAFRLTHESRFCFHYSGVPPSFNCGGPRNYNSYT